MKRKKRLRWIMMKFGTIRVFGLKNSKMIFVLVGYNVW